MLTVAGCRPHWANRTRQPKERLLPDYSLDARRLLNYSDAVGRLLLVRHGRPEVAPGLAPSQWALAADARNEIGRLGSSLDLGTDTVVVASTERKAIETAEALMKPRSADASDRFREVRKPWFDDSADHRAAVQRYFAGEVLSDWEPLAEATRRFEEGVEEHRDRDVVIVTHGIVMTAWIASATELPDPFQFWTGLRMPDVWEVDLATSRSWRLPDG